MKSCKYQPYNLTRDINISHFSLIFLILIFIYGIKREINKKYILLSAHPYKKHFKQINITYSTDINTYLILIVSITSMIEHSTNLNLFYNIYVLTIPNFDKKAKDRIESLQHKYNRLLVQVIPVDQTIPNLVNFKNTNASSYRLLSPLIFPEMKRLIHLDCDTYVFKDLDYFYDLNMTNLEFRGNLDFDLYCELPKLGFKNDRYINAGVLLMNLDQLRKDNFIEKVKNFSLIFGQKLKFPIQAVINSISYDKSDFLPPEIGFFNCFSSEETYKSYFRAPYIKKHYKYEDIHKVLNNITISHLIFKPWMNKECIYRNEWGKWL